LKKRSNKKTIIYFVLAWLVCAFLLESTDLWISVNVYNPKSWWSILLEGYGEIPGLIVALIGIHIYVVTFKSSSNTRKILLTAFLLTTSAFITIYIFFTISNALTGNYNFFESYKNYFYFSAIIINIFISYLYRRRNKFSKKLVIFSRLSFNMFFYGYLIFIVSLKLFWGRIRFRDLAANYSNFTPWYLPQGVTGNDSFPSGHTAMGWMLISLFVLFADKSRSKRLILKGSILSWAAAVGVSRIIIGAHFTSDVVFASFIMIITYLVSLNYVTKNINSELE
jgi:membrane-associated phospholipid phosphatase